MVAETALRWDVIKHSGSEESLEPWKKNIDELGGYMRDPGRIDGMKKELDAVLVKFVVCLHILFTTIHVR